MQTPARVGAWAMPQYPCNRMAQRRVGEWHAGRCQLRSYGVVADPTTLEPEDGEEPGVDDSAALLVRANEVVE